MRNLKMRKVAQEIIELKIDKRTLGGFRKKFYKIMSDNSIKEGEWTKNGYIIANPEWTVCKSLFLDRVRDSLEMAFFFNTPEDLQAYGEKPNKK